jgi:formylglycine-generating enzyme required for sulfatase activity
MSYKPARGGCWFGTAEVCRSAYRNRNAPSNRNDYYGFRVVKDVEPSTRTLRGGGWYSSSNALASSFLFGRDPSFRSDNGFRVVKEINNEL